MIRLKNLIYICLIFTIFLECSFFKKRIIEAKNEKGNYKLIIFFDYKYEAYLDGYKMESGITYIYNDTIVFYPKYIHYPFTVDTKINCAYLYENKKICFIENYFDNVYNNNIINYKNCYTVTKYIK